MSPHSLQRVPSAARDDADSAGTHDGSDGSSGTSPSQLAGDLPLARRRRLAWRTAWWAAAIVAALLLIGGLTQRILTQGIAQLMENYLGSLRDNASGRLIDAFAGMEDDVRRLAADPRLVTAVGEPATATALLHQLADQAGADDLLLFAADGRVVAASGGQIPPLTRTLGQAVVESASATSLPVAPGILSSHGNRSENPGEIPLTAVVAPLPGRAGWLVLRCAAVPLFTHLFDIGRPGSSGETYLFDARGTMLSRSRFEDELRRRGLLAAGGDTGGSAMRVALRDPGDGTVPVEARPLTLLAARALTTGRGLTVDAYRNYRGVEVIGAWDWIPAYGIGVGVEMDRAEAFLAIGRLHLLFSGLLGLLGLALLGLLGWWRRAAMLRARARLAERRIRELGQYQLLEQIGHGGMGRVFRARHRLLRRPTAIKLLITEDATSEDLKRFEREANLTAGLTSPHTVRVFDFGRAVTGEFYIVMELLDGLDLTRLVVTHGAQPEARVIHWMLQACDSLAEAHAQGLIHRDLKPQNLFACRQGRRRDVLKVLDFGLAKQLANEAEGQAFRQDTSGLTGYGQVAGTPGFMAPEQVVGAPIDNRIDLYALGCCMYWLLTGGQVFPHDQGASSVYKHLHAIPDPPSVRLPPGAVSREMDAVVMRLLAKDRDARIASADELAALLRALPLAGRWSEDAADAWWSRAEAEIPHPSASGEAVGTISVA